MPPEDVVVELVVTGQGDQTSPGRGEREEDLVSSSLPHLKEQKKV
jgi:hypothetical protein